MKAHLLFEQSGTFKKEFIKFGINAFDYDILNDFNETNFQIDLFNEIDKAYAGGESIFDSFKSEDIIFAFFPCVRFEAQILLWFCGDNYGQRSWGDVQKLEYDLKLHDELNMMYKIITKLVIVCIKRNLRLIIENPYTEQHYLTRYWSIKPKVIDDDRRFRGDYYKKPTQYWFINCEPKSNLILESMETRTHTSIVDTHDKVERSLIAPEYANRFIREYIL